MAITINSIAITDEYTGDQNGGADTGTTTLMGSIVDKMWAKITFEVHWETINVPMTFSGSIVTRTDCGLGAGSFIDDGFRDGDTINIEGEGYYYDEGNYTIATVTDTTITITGSFPVDGSYSTISIYGTTPILAMDFYYNTIGINNGQSFKSLSDIKYTQKTTASWASNPSNQNMTPVGASLAWWEGLNPKVDYLGVGPTNNFSRQYTIVIPFFIKPFGLSNQITNLQNQYKGTPDLPEQWVGDDCMSFLYQIDARFSTTDPTVDLTSGVQQTSGNTGWYNEFLNGGTANYTLQSISYTVSGNSVTQIDPVNPTDVTIVINSVNSVFKPTSVGPPYVPIVLNFFKVPISSGSYQNTSTDFREDFIHDRAFQKLGQAAVNGDQYGTGYQVITNYTITYISDSQVSVSFTTNMGTDAKAAFSTTTDSYYVITLTPQGRTATTLATTDRNAILCDVNQASTDTDNPNLLTISTDSTTDVHFFNSPDIDINPQTDFQGMQGEYSYAKCDFLVPVQTQINNINVKIQTVLYNTLVADEFDNIISTLDLENFSNNTSKYFDGYTNNIDITVYNNFPLSSADPRNMRSIQRKPSLDGSGLLGYEILYGFQVGYSYFQPLTNGISAFQKYGSNLWSGYYSQSSFNGGTLPPNTAVRTDLLITWDVLDPATNLITEFNRRCAISPGDDGFNTDGVVTAMTTADMNGTDMNGWVANDQMTEVTFSFTSAPYGYAFPSAPAGYSYRATIGIWYDDGSKQTLDITDSVFDLQDGSLWMDKPIIDSSKTSEMTVTAYFNGEGLNFNQFRFYCNLSFVHN